MSFLETTATEKQTNYKKRAHSLQSISNRLTKRISLFTSFCCKGGMALEASLTIPIFLLFIMTIMSFMEVLCLRSDLTGALHQAGNTVAFTSYAQEETNVQRAEAIIEKYMLNNAAYSHWILPEGALQFGQSEYKESSGNLHLVVTCEPTYFSGWFPLPQLQIVSQYYGHCWVGYCGGDFAQTEVMKDCYVYITETGTVYHKDRACTYLNPSIQTTSKEELVNKRNQAGGIYHICELCGNGNGNYVYVTTYGDRCHSDRMCSGLKRTIYTIRLSEVGKRPPCSKCGF